LLSESVLFLLTLHVRYRGSNIFTLATSSTETSNLTIS
jgi:hypothetical protein